MIELQNISKYYYTDTSVTLALNKISLKFPDKGFVAITGESGSGKSTLLNIISGLDTFDDGEMYFNGKPTFQFDSADWERYRRKYIGFVFQNYGLVGHYSALDNCMVALLIQGLSAYKARKKAMEYLEKVGLKDQALLRASELSSGQKQRLSIARALAKNTDIIVADEPTGNLDSETSAQIIELLSELSKERLIIMVTHDYERVEEVATRKIRLHDGELVSNIKVNMHLIEGENGQVSQELTEEEVDDSVDNASEDEKEKNETGDIDTQPLTEDNKDEKGLWKEKLSVAVRFLGLDLKGQKSRTFLFLMFFLFTSLISFVFLGELFVNADDRITKKYDDTAFLNDSDKRILIMRKDGERLKKSDIKEFKEIKYVTDADIYDLCHDISYYVNEGEDYTFDYGDKKATGEEVKSINFIETKKFMMSTEAIENDDLEEGYLPSKRNEIVVYKTGKQKLGDKVHIYLRDDNIWDDGSFYENDFTITGFLKKESKQIYFAPRFCSAITASIGGPAVGINFYYSDKFKKFYGKDTFIPIIGDNLAYNEIRASLKYSVDMGGESEVAGITSVPQAFTGVANIVLTSNDDMIEYNLEPDFVAKPNGEGLRKGCFEVYNYFDEDNENPEDNYGKYNPMFIEVSEEIFNAIYPENNSTFQGDVYITDYTKTDSVIKALDKKGYIGMSTYRVSTTEYIPEKVMSRLITICISVGVLIILIVLQILIIRALMKIKINEFYIFKFMGMRLSQIDLLIKLTICFYGLLSSVIILFVASIAGMLRVKEINDILRFYDVPNTLIYFAYVLIMAYLTAIVFARMIRTSIDKKKE